MFVYRCSMIYSTIQSGGVYGRNRRARKTKGDGERREKGKVGLTCEPPTLYSTYI